MRIRIHTQSNVVTTAPEIIWCIGSDGRRGTVEINMHKIGHCYIRYDVSFDEPQVIIKPFAEYDQCLILTLPAPARTFAVDNDAVLQERPTS